MSLINIGILVLNWNLKIRYVEEEVIGSYRYTYRQCPGSENI